MRLVTCKLQEIDEWFDRESDLPRDARSLLDLGNGFRAEIGPHGNSVLVRDSQRRQFVVKLLKGYAMDGFDRFEGQVYNSRPSPGRIELSWSKTMDRGLKKWGAFWLVIDEN